MNVSDDMLMMYADDELEPPDRTIVDAAIASDPALAARVAALRSQRVRLRQAYAPMLDEVVPQRLHAVIENTALPAASQVVDFAARRASRSVRQRLTEWSWPEWSAIAASLVIGILAMQPQSQRFADSPVRSGPAGLVAGRSLATVLSSQLASTQSPDAAVQVGLSFENASGQLCRTFAEQGARPWSGLACFTNGEWHVGMMVEGAGPARRQAPGTMRTAASEVPPAMLRVVTEQIRGEPLDAGAERAARDRGWRPQSAGEVTDRPR